TNPDRLTDSDIESAILSVLKSRTRREAPPVADATEPETAAHYASLIVPQDYYSRYPKSDLFRMRSGRYINDLLPIFKKETPTAKVDPVPASQLPVEPPPRSNNVDNFPFWNQQASNWVWPDGISTGSLPSALFGLQNKALKSVEMASLPAVDIDPGAGDTGALPAEAAEATEIAETEEIPPPIQNRGFPRIRGKPSSLNKSVLR
ncbi:hypothetical protein PoB_002206200, partial [Plakobranchus ocellatus]